MPKTPPSHHMAAASVHSHFGIYAAIIQNGHILVIRKARGPYTGLLDLPGGTPEPLEMPEETLYREVHEETGCTVTTHQQGLPAGALFHHTKNGQPAIFHHLGIIYPCTITGTPRTTGDGEDSNGCLWLPLAEATPHTVTPFVLQACAAGS